MGCRRSSRLSLSMLQPHLRITSLPGQVICTVRPGSVNRPYPVGEAITPSAKEVHTVFLTDNPLAPANTSVSESVLRISLPLPIPPAVYFTNPALPMAALTLSTMPTIAPLSSPGVGVSPGKPPILFLRSQPIWVLPLLPTPPNYSWVML